MKKLFDVPDSYKEHITKFDSSDGFLALGIIVTYFVVMTISGIIVQYISQLQITIIGGGINVFFVVLVLLCLKMRHQGIETIGLKEGNIRLSFVLGGTLAAILFFCNCLSNVLFEHQSFIDFAVFSVFFATSLLVLIAVLVFLTVDFTFLLSFIFFFNCLIFAFDF